MRCGHSGMALMLAGVVVVLIGAAVALVRALDLPGYWIPLAVGAALVAAGALRRAGPGGA